MGDRNLVFVSNLCLKSLSLVFVSGGAEGCGGDDAEGTGDFWGGHRQRLGVSPGKVRTIARNCGVTSGGRALAPVTENRGPMSGASARGADFFTASQRLPGGDRPLIPCGLLTGSRRHGPCARGASIGKKGGRLASPPPFPIDAPP